MKRLIALFCITLCLVPAAMAVPAPPEIAAPSAVLMDAAGGRILYEKNAHEKLHPASVTKIMSLLLTMEAMDWSRRKR